MEIKKVGVVGCGIMGSGIAQVCAQSGYQVLVSDINEERLNKGLTSIDKTLAKSVEKGKLSQENKDSILSRIKGFVSANDFSDFSECDLIIEAVTEDLGTKKQVFTMIDEVCPGQTILATNTSTLSVINLAAMTKKSDKVMGMHFFNPAPIMQLVELVKTIATSNETIEVGKEFAKSLGKTSVIANDIDGFIANRVTTPFFLTAVRMVEANFATAEDIDTAMRLGYNHPMGPLALLDLIGLDTFLRGISSMYEETKDPQFAPPTLLKKMVAGGWLGRKTGRGFHIYK
ncbi:MAG: 3-hydroxyacyl-CoA dehydrogenase family protein [Thermodesulfobacteriota bacterium]